MLFCAVALPKLLYGSVACSIQSNEVTTNSEIRRACCVVCWCIPVWAVYPITTLDWIPVKYIASWDRQVSIFFSIPFFFLPCKEYKLQASERERKTRGIRIDRVAISFTTLYGLQLGTFLWRTLIIGSLLFIYCFLWRQCSNNPCVYCFFH